MFSTHLGFLRRKIPSHGSVLYLCDRGDTWSQSGENVLAAVTDRRVGPRARKSIMAGYGKSIAEIIIHS